MDGQDHDITTTLRDVWTLYLGTPHIGMDDDFFKLGGNSMSAVRMLSSVITRFEADLELTVFFEQPTLRTLSGLLQEAGRF